MERTAHSESLAFVESLYADYLRDPASVPERWQEYFKGLAATNGHAANGHAAPRVGPSFPAHSIFNPARLRGGAGLGADSALNALQDRVDQLVRAYRVRGHMRAQIDPLGLPREHRPELDPEYYGFEPRHLDLEFSSRTIAGSPRRTLREIIEKLHNTYCRTVGVQYMHIDESRVRHWLQDRMESSENRIPLRTRDQLRILTRLTDAVIFEEFIQKKFLGAKSFSLEGGETLIPLLDMAIEKAGGQKIDEIVLGMAHRGRLNVLANILGKSPRAIFREFQDADAQTSIGRGDVKYHLGYHGDWTTAAGHTVHMALCFNPSHLEFVNPVALGRVRAKQDRLGDTNRERAMAVLIHGDAAFAGEGIVQETLNLSELAGYRIGGTLHIIVNNQIGFTTIAEDGRSSLYASAIGKMLQIPIFHVNGEDPEAVAAVIDLAMDFRAEFRRDVIIDMYCYRKRGHNETDEPAFTQPLMYKAIRKRKSVRDSYLEHITKLGSVSREEADEIEESLRQRLENELTAAREEGAKGPARPARFSVLGEVWKNYRGGPDANVPDVDTGTPRDRLDFVSDAITSVPNDFHPHPKTERLLEQRREMARGEKPLDWAMAEALAFGTLAVEGYRIRLTGQDCGRGTFSQRHAVLHDYEDGHTWCGLANIWKDQAPVEIRNSPLSEAGVVGYDYGYSLAYPDALVCWEAQFGDFVNAAQVIIDQFISSAEDKWHSLSGLTMLLPHGFEGQGPEHSSARVERFLQLAAEDNLQVCYPSTPAQYFHLLRRQVVRPWRKPLVVLTPKSLLRHHLCVSSLEDLTHGTFQRVIPDAKASPKKVKRVLLCSGKIYYELLQERDEHDRHDVAIVRLEQIYPLRSETLAPALDPFQKDVPIVWVQEEPRNMGAWSHLKLQFGDSMCGRRLVAVTRPPSASPATGSAGAHKIEQRDLLDRAFAEATIR